MEKTLKGKGKLKHEKYEEKTKLTLAISHSPHRFNHSVGSFTTYGIIYRLIQTALNGHTAKLYPASCQVTVNQAMSPFAHHLQTSLS